MNISRLTKLLRLTESPVEGEALSAIRRANELLKANGLTWDDVVSGRLGEDHHPALDHRPILFRGVTLLPPIRTWSETAAFLLTQTLRIDQYELRNLERLAARLRQGERPKPIEASFLVCRYLEVAGHPAGAGGQGRA